MINAAVVCDCEFGNLRRNERVFVIDIMARHGHCHHIKACLMTVIFTCTCFVIIIKVNINARQSHAEYLAASPTKVRYTTLVDAIASRASRDGYIVLLMTWR